MDGATKRVSEYIRHKGFNLSDISRKTHIPYMALYDSLFNEKRNRDLRVDEFLILCNHLGVNPIIFFRRSEKGGLDGTNNKKLTGAPSHQLLPKFVHPMYFADCSLKPQSIAEAPDHYIHVQSHLRRQAFP